MNTAAQCSTANISHARNRTGPRLPIGLRPWTSVQRILTWAGISQREIAAASGVPLASVNRALDLRWCGRSRFDNVLRVRTAIVALLTERAISHDAATLWTDYDTPILAEDIDA